MNSRTRALIAAPLLALAAASASALGVADAQNDFLPTYTGPQGGDLDVLFAYGIFNAGAQTFTFGATMSAPIGTTAGALYVWGFDRGAGTERFVGGTPSVGAGVFFDSVLALTNTGTGTLNLLDGSPAVPLAPGAIEISGNTITATLAAASLPSRGRGFGEYGWNLWPRLGAGNAAISDFAPDASTPPVVTVVPEPGSLALLLAGGLVLLAVKRRSAA